MIISFTQKKVESLKCPKGKSKIEFCCAEFPGLLLEVRSGTSSPTWMYRYKVAGKTKYKRIGHLSSHTLAQAKQEAVQLKADIQNGRDPRAEINRLKEVPTFREFTEQHYLPYIKSRLRSARTSENRLRQRLLPAFGDQRMNTITRKQLVEFHLQLKSEGLAGATCDHFVKLVRSMFNLAIQWSVVSDNPASKIALFNDPNQVENYLNDEQLSRLLAVLHTDDSILVSKVALFLLSTGSRLNEALTAQWEYVDLKHRTWCIPAAISKSKNVRAIPLNQSAIDVLLQLQPEPDLRQGHLFVNPKTGMRLKTVHKAWHKIRVSAGVPFLRIHDLRHMYASFLVNSGRTLYEVQQVLGHSSPQVTQRYAHLSTETVQAAASAASDRIRDASPRLLPPPPDPS